MQMEEALEGVQTGAVKTLQLTQAQDKLKFDDHSYIQVWAHYMQSVSAKCSHLQTFHPLSRHTVISQYINRTLSVGPKLVFTFNINTQHTMLSYTMQRIWDLLLCLFTCTDIQIPRLAQAHEAVQTLH